MNGYNDNITDQQLVKLQELFPEVFTEGKVNWPQLRATLGDAIDSGDSYGLSWKGKSGVFAKIQEKTVETLRPDRDNSVDWDTTGNMFIEGDNLAALKILHKSYYGKVKMIYIDPPYNTGNDFVYNDDFKQTRKSYEAEAGIVDDEGNITRDDGLRANTGGHKHSNWLNMMYPRLFLARNLLRQDGVIFVSIDDNEVHNLRLMMNEIFGEENFVGSFVKPSKIGGGSDSKHIVKEHEYVLAFARSIENLQEMFIHHDESYISRYKYLDDQGRYFWDTYARPGLATGPNDSLIYTITAPDGTQLKERWRRSKERFQDDLQQGIVRISKKSDGDWSVQFKQYLNEAGKKPRSLTSKMGDNNMGRDDFVSVMNDAKVFEYPKPKQLVKFLAQIISDKDAVIVDFFSGSGTTAHAVAELNAEDGGNRQWICVQLPEQTSEKSEAFKAGYTNIADIARERIRRAGAKIRTDFADKLAEREIPLDLGFRAYRVGESNFKPWNELVADPEEIRQQMLDSLDPIEPDATDESILTELLLKRGVSPLTEIEDRDVYLFVPSANLAISLAPDLTEAECSEILASSAQTILILSRALGTNETLRMNLTLQAEQQGVKVEVV